MTFLYIETNFLIGYAKNQDQDAETLIRDLHSLQPLKIFIPSICCMESLSVFKDEKRRRNEFEQSLNREIKTLQRNINSVYSKQICKDFQTARVSNEKMTNDIESRLFKALDWISKYAELIDLEKSILQESIDTILISDPTDNLILTCILNHSKQDLAATKVFLSNNSEDFGKKEIKEILQDAGISKYLTSTKDFLGWLKTQHPANTSQIS